MENLHKLSGSSRSAFLIDTPRFYCSPEQVPQGVKVERGVSFLSNVASLGRVIMNDEIRYEAELERLGRLLLDEVDDMLIEYSDMVSE